MDATLAGRESNFNAGNYNPCDTDSHNTIHFYHTIGFVLARVALGRVISSVWRRNSSGSLPLLLRTDVSQSLHLASLATYFTQNIHTPDRVFRLHGAYKLYW